jgi:hypothetical protein
VFLEVNPQGQCQWIEELTGLPINEALCDLLAGEPVQPATPHPETSDGGPIDAGPVCRA